ncbi:restriction endonuclease subunit S [Propionibacterium ruminifibrarum]|nr:restriction endonuclease subunit S [Propionibacterium ruminifibrarum]
MSRIDDLVKELCPDGVMGVPLGDLCTFNRGRWIKASELHEGTIPVVTSSQNVSAWHDESNRRGETIVVASSGAYAGFVSFWNEPIYVSNAFSVDPNESSGIVPKFLFHVLRRRQREINAMASVAGVPNVYGKDLARMVVQIPPLAVQREIVRILDQFTQLEAELEAELEARKTQYAYYRDHLTVSLPDARSVRLGDVLSIVRGASPRPIRRYFADSSGVPWIKIGDVSPLDKFVTGTRQYITEAGAAKSRRVYPDDFILSNSMSYGRPYISAIEGCVHDGWLVLSDYQDAFNVDYLYHLLRSAPIQADFSRRVGSGTVSNLNSKIVGATMVAVPPLEEQRRIADILDKFDALVNDLNSGLPAEIAARRKQYEYYRDRLLTFPEKGASA